MKFKTAPHVLTLKTAYAEMVMANASETTLSAIKTAVTLAEAEFAPKQVAKRTRIAFRPVMVENTRFASITDGARYLAGRRSAYANKREYTLAVQRNIKQITKKCNQDCWDGYYWAE